MSSELRPENPIPRTLCAWYGFHLTIGDEGQLLSDSRGNECPWIGGLNEACPCAMEMKQQVPNANLCPVALRIVPDLILWYITVWPQELPGHITHADVWQEYVMSPSCPRPVIVSTN